MLNQSYKDLNRAYFEVVCSRSNNQVLYLDLDDTIISEMRVNLPSSYQSITEHDVLRTVSQNVDISRPKEAIVNFWSASRSWQVLTSQQDSWTENNPPPTLLFLAVTGVAAREMGNEVFNSNAFYPQLAKLLNLPESSAHSLGESFRYKKSYIEIWDVVDEWLTNTYGLYGMPSAKPIGSHAYVGRAISQSLIRRTDFEAIENLFAQELSTPSLDEIGMRLDTALAERQIHISRTFRLFWSLRASSVAIGSVRSIMTKMVEQRLAEILRLNS